MLSANKSDKLLVITKQSTK